MNTNLNVYRDCLAKITPEAIERRRVRLLAKDIREGHLRELLDSLKVALDAIDFRVTASPEGVPRVEIASGVNRDERGLNRHSCELHHRLCRFEAWEN